MPVHRHIPVIRPVQAYRVSLKTSSHFTLEMTKHNRKRELGFPEMVWTLLSLPLPAQILDA